MLEPPPRANSSTICSRPRRRIGSGPAPKSRTSPSNEHSRSVVCDEKDCSKGTTSATASGATHTSTESQDLKTRTALDPRFGKRWRAAVESFAWGAPRNVTAVMADR